MSNFFKGLFIFCLVLGIFLVFSEVILADNGIEQLNLLNQGDADLRLLNIAAKSTQDFLARDIAKQTGKLMPEILPIDGGVVFGSGFCAEGGSQGSCGLVSDDFTHQLRTLLKCDKTSGVNVAIVQRQAADTFGVSRHAFVIIKMPSGIYLYDGSATQFPDLLRYIELKDPQFADSLRRGRPILLDNSKIALYQDGFHFEEAYASYAVELRADRFGKNISSEEIFLKSRNEFREALGKDYLTVKDLVNKQEGIIEVDVDRLELERVRKNLGAAAYEDALPSSCAPKPTEPDVPCKGEIASKEPLPEEAAVKCDPKKVDIAKAEKDLIDEVKKLEDEVKTATAGITDVKKVAQATRDVLKKGLSKVLVASKKLKEASKCLYQEICKEDITKLGIRNAVNNKVIGGGIANVVIFALVEAATSDKSGADLALEIAEHVPENFVLGVAFTVASDVAILTPVFGAAGATVISGGIMVLGVASIGLVIGDAINSSFEDAAERLQNQEIGDRSKFLKGDFRDLEREARAQFQEAINLGLIEGSFEASEQFLDFKADRSHWINLVNKVKVNSNIFAAIVIKNSKSASALNFARQFFLSRWVRDGEDPSVLFGNELFRKEARTNFVSMTRGLLEKELTRLATKIAKEDPLLGRTIFKVLHNLVNNSQLNLNDLEKIDLGSANVFLQIIEKELKQSHVQLNDGNDEAYQRGVLQRLVNLLERLTKDSKEILSCENDKKSQDAGFSSKKDLLRIDLLQDLQEPHSGLKPSSFNTQLLVPLAQIVNVSHFVASIFDQIIGAIRGGVENLFNPAALTKEVVIPLPGIGEYHAIVGFFDKNDAQKIELRNQTITIEDSESNNRSFVAKLIIEEKDRATQLNATLGVGIATIEVPDGYPRAQYLDAGPLFVEEKNISSRSGIKTIAFPNMGIQVAFNRDRFRVNIEVRSVDNSVNKKTDATVDRSALNKKIGEQRVEGLLQQGVVTFDETSKDGAGSFNAKIEVIYRPSLPGYEMRMSDAVYRLASSNFYNDDNVSVVGFSEHSGEADPCNEDKDIKPENSWELWGLPSGKGSYHYGGFGGGLVGYVNGEARYPELAGVYSIENNEYKLPIVRTGTAFGYGAGGKIKEDLSYFWKFDSKELIDKVVASYAIGIVTDTKYSKQEYEIATAVTRGGADATFGANKNEEVIKKEYQLSIVEPGFEKPLVAASHDITKAKVRVSDKQGGLAKGIPVLSSGIKSEDESAQFYVVGLTDGAGELDIPYEMPEDFESVMARLSIDANRDGVPDSQPLYLEFMTPLEYFKRKITLEVEDMAIKDYGTGIYAWLYSKSLNKGSEIVFGNNNMIIEEDKAHLLAVNSLIYTVKNGEIFTSISNHLTYVVLIWRGDDGAPEYKIISIDPQDSSSLELKVGDDNINLNLLFKRDNYDYKSTGELFSRLYQDGILISGAPTIAP